MRMGFDPKTNGGLRHDLPHTLNCIVTIPRGSPNATAPGSSRFDDSAFPPPRNVLLAESTEDFHRGQELYGQQASRLHEPGYREFIAKHGKRIVHHGIWSACFRAKSSDCIKVGPSEPMTLSMRVCSMVARLLQEISES